jgi:hypothetical protein
LHTGGVLQDFLQTRIHITLLIKVLTNSLLTLKAIGHQISWLMLHDLLLIHLMHILLRTHHRRRIPRITTRLRHIALHIWWHTP